MGKSSSRKLRRVIYNILYRMDPQKTHYKISFSAKMSNIENLEKSVYISPLTPDQPPFKGGYYVLPSYTLTPIGRCRDLRTQIPKLRSGECVHIIITSNYCTSILLVRKHPTTIQASFFTSILLLCKHPTTMQASYYYASILLLNKHPTTIKASYYFEGVSF